jgi:hypothetical protein
MKAMLPSFDTDPGQLVADHARRSAAIDDILLLGARHPPVL